MFLDFGYLGTNNQCNRPTRCVIYTKVDVHIHSLIRLELSILRWDNLCCCTYTIAIVPMLICNYHCHVYIHALVITFALRVILHVIMLISG